MFKDFNRVRKETATRVCPSKKWKEPRYNLEEKDLWYNQNKMVLLVVGGIRKEGQAWQEIKNKRQRRLSTPVHTKHKSRRRICGLDGGLSKM